MTTKCPIASARREDARRQRREQQQRIDDAKRETTRVVQSGKCPCCGSGIRRNLALAGWFQCEQFGSEGFRKDSSRPSCSWQGFTE